MPLVSFMELFKTLATWVSGWKCISASYQIVCLVSYCAPQEEELATFEKKKKIGRFQKKVLWMVGSIPLWWPLPLPLISFILEHLANSLKLSNVQSCIPRKSRLWLVLGRCSVYVCGKHKCMKQIFLVCITFTNSPCHPLRLRASLHFDLLLYILPFLVLLKQPFIMWVP